VLLVQHSRPIASAETEDHRLRRIMLIGLRVSFSRRNVWPDQSRLTPVIVSPKLRLKSILRLWRFPSWNN